MIDQLTIFLQNEKGRLAAACEALSQADINLHSLFLADTQDFGVARMICDTPKKASAALGEAGFRAAVTPVLAVKVPNVPGGLSKLLQFLDSKDVNVEYGYCFTVNNEMAVDVLKVGSDAQLEADMSAAGFEVVNAEDIYELD